MSATTHAEGGEELGRYEDDFGGQLPVRPRRQWLTPWTALFFAVMIGAAGFYVGIRIEKGNVSSPGAGSLAGASGRSGAPGRAGGFASRFGGGAPGGFAAGFGGAGGSASIGTVAGVDGSTIYLTDTSGNTIKVKLNSATTISKTQSVSRKRLYPGDSIVVTGTKAKNGTVTATRVSDSGASGSRSTGAGSSSGSSGGGNVNAAINSLFGGR